MFIMIDGIDGSGKSTIVETWKKYLIDQGKKVFDLKKFWIDFDRYPTLEEMKDFDIIFSAEMTHVGIGKVIRQEMINKDNHYPPLAIAQAYSLDRLILYTKIIIPCLALGKTIVQDRGVSSSLAYQPTMPGLDLKTVSELVGNQLALQNRPDYLAIVDVEPETAISRIASRFDKQDNSIFEKVEILKKISAQFHLPEYQEIFQNRKTAISYLNGNEKVDIMKSQAISWLTNIFK